MANAAITSERIASQPGGRRLFAPRTFKRQSRQRFFRDRRARWSAHLGGNPVDAQAILIDQVIGLEWDIRRLEDRHERNGKLSAHDKNELAAWRRHLREAIRQLGPAKLAKAQTLEEFAAQIVRERAAGAAT